MKRYLYFLSAVLMMAGCGSEEVLPEEPETPQEPKSEKVDFTYDLTSSPLLSLDGGWKAGDRLMLVVAGASSSFTLGSPTTAQTAQVSGKAAATASIYAAYPYSPDLEFLGSGFQNSIPDKQSGKDVASLSFCAAKLASSPAKMRDMSARLIFSLPQNEYTSLKITSSTGEDLCGKVKLTFQGDGAYTVKTDGVSSSITITPGTDGKFAAGDYTIACFALGEESMLKFEAVDGAGKSYVSFVENCGVSFGNSREVGTLSFEEVVPEEPPVAPTVLKTIKLVFLAEPDSKAFQWPFASPIETEISTSSNNGNGSFKEQAVDLVLPESEGGYKFTCYGTQGMARNGGGNQGFKFGGGVGDYIILPGIEDMHLVQIKLRTGYKGNAGKPKIFNNDGSRVLTGGDVTPEFTEKGEEFVWTLTDSGKGEACRMIFHSTQLLNAQILEFVYSSTNTIEGGQDEEPPAPPVDISSDQIPDFSRVGYHYGDKEIPDVEVKMTLEAPADGSDATSLIQNAIKTVQTPGAILLKAGTYYIGGELKIERNGVVLRGEGLSTVLYSTATTQQTALITIGKSSTRTLETYSDIIDSYTPCGSMYVKVLDSGRFRKGDKVFIFRPGTNKWISDLHMNEIPPRTSGDVSQWTASGFSLYWERTVTESGGGYVYFDNPVVMGIGGEGYGTGKLYRGTYPRISECGVENLMMDSRYDATIRSGNDYTDESHCWHAIKVLAAENSWIRKVSTKHFGNSGVLLDTGAKLITVSDCHVREPVSVVTGGRRYAFNLNDPQQCLVKDCTCDDDRHQFVLGSRVAGPNVFLRCTGTKSRSEAGPHHRWSTGTLFDNVKVSTQLNLHDRSNAGSGHGWACANTVLYNCTAATIVCQSPWSSAQNWCIGCIGTKKSSAMTYSDKLGKRPDGTWVSPGVRVTPESLYESQLAERHAKGIWLNDL